MYDHGRFVHWVDYLHFFQTTIFLSCRLLMWKNFIDSLGLKIKSFPAIFGGAGSMPRLSSPVDPPPPGSGYVAGKPWWPTVTSALQLAGSCPPQMSWESAETQRRKPTFMKSAWMAGTPWCKHCRDHKVFKLKMSHSCRTLAIFSNVNSNLLGLTLSVSNYKPNR